MQGNFVRSPRTTCCLVTEHLRTLTHPTFQVSKPAANLIVLVYLGRADAMHWSVIAHPMRDEADHNHPFLPSRHLLQPLSPRLEG